MYDIKLIRWATYFLPGSLVIFPMWLLLEKIAGLKVITFLNFPYSIGFLLVALSVLSYIVGMGLWGVAYHKKTQERLFSDPHLKRREYIFKICNSQWYKNKNFPEPRTLFPTLISVGPKSEEAYHDFEFSVVKSYFSKSPQMIERIMQDRETIGLIQSLILGLIIFSIFFAGFTLITFFKKPGQNWRYAVSLFCVTIVAGCTIFMLKIHYKQRQKYFVRDVLMTFLSEHRSES